MTNPKAEGRSPKEIRSPKAENSTAYCAVVGQVRGTYMRL